MPRDTHELRVLSRALHCSPAAHVGWTQDVYGNLVATAGFAAPTDELTIAIDLLIDQSALAWPIIPIAPSAHRYPFSYDPDEVAGLGTLLVPESSGDPARLARWARSFVLGETTDTLTLLNDVNTGVSAILYRRRDEEGTQSPSQTLAFGSGTCRDLAALFIDVVRHLGVAARAVSGYLHDPDGISNAAGATHAWAEVYLPHAGWVAFDPTHRRLGSAHLIPVAVARCNAQIMPVTGGYDGDRDDAIDMAVTVEVTRHDGDPPPL